MIGRKPLVEHIRDLDGALAEVKAARRLLTSMTRLTLDLYRYFEVRISVGHDLLLDSPRPGAWQATARIGAYEPRRAHAAGVRNPVTKGPNPEQS